MSDFLKGNYNLDKDIKASEEKKEKSFIEEFEEKALEKLGGSIAFVSKANQFVWEDEDESSQ